MSSTRYYRKTVPAAQDIREFLRQSNSKIPETARRERRSVHDERLQETRGFEATLSNLIPQIPINEYLQCPICTEFAVTPVYSCENGHIICGICFEKVKKCNSCDKDLSPNGLVERILRMEGVRFPCRNSNFGCTQKIKPSDMKRHLSTCDYRLIRCQEVLTNICNKTSYSPEDLFDHWKDHHKISELPVSPSNLKDGVCTVTQLQVAFLDKDEYRWRNSYFECDGRTFFLHIICQAGIVYVWVTCLENEVEAKQYKYTVSLLGNIENGAQITWNKFPVHCLQYYNFDKIKEAGHVGVLHSNTLKMFQKEPLVIPNSRVKASLEDNFTWWTLRIDLLKP